MPSQTAGAMLAHNSVTGYRAPRAALDTDVCVTVANCTRVRRAAEPSDSPAAGTRPGAAAAAGHPLAANVGAKAPAALAEGAVQGESEGSDHELFLFGTLSNSQKVDPWVFYVWMNVLRRFPRSKLVFMDYKGTDYAMPNIRNVSRAHGIAGDRLAKAAQQPWINHLYSKTAFDLLLDTTSKNGHTTGLDGAWAGVPTVTMVGHSATKRAGQSIAAALEDDYGYYAQYGDAGTPAWTENGPARPGAPTLLPAPEPASPH